MFFTLEGVVPRLIAICTMDCTDTMLLRLRSAGGRLARLFRRLLLSTFPLALLRIVDQSLIAIVHGPSMLFVTLAWTGAPSMILTFITVAMRMMRHWITVWNHCRIYITGVRCCIVCFVQVSNVTRHWIRAARTGPTMFHLYCSHSCCSLFLGAHREHPPLQGSIDSILSVPYLLATHWTNRLLHEPIEQTVVMEVMSTRCDDRAYFDIFKTNWTLALLFFGREHTLIHREGRNHGASRGRASRRGSRGLW